MRIFVALAIQEEINELSRELDRIEIRKAKGVAIRSKVKWKQVGDKCLAESLKSIKKKNAQATLSELKDQLGQSFTN